MATYLSARGWAPRRPAQDPEIAAAWERLSWAQREALLQGARFGNDVAGGPRLSAEEPAWGCRRATLLALCARGLVEWQGVDRDGWWGEFTPLGRRLAEHGMSL